MSDEPTYSLNELAKATGITTHMIRHWMRRGYLPPTVPRGPYTRYEEQHRLWIKAIILAMAGGMTQRQAVAHVDSLESVEDLAAAAGEPMPKPAPPAPVAPPPLPVAPGGAPRRDANEAHARGVWERVPIYPGVELHVRLDADPKARKLAMTIEETFAKSTRGGTEGA
ncbi:MAG: helix-turn-helix domain-containing protein [Polyangiaceae bacterium]